MGVKLKKLGARPHIKEIILSFQLKLQIKVEHKFMEKEVSFKVILKIIVPFAGLLMES